MFNRFLYVYQRVISPKWPPNAYPIFQSTAGSTAQPVAKIAAALCIFGPHSPGHRVQCPPGPASVGLAGRDGVHLETSGKIGNTSDWSLVHF